MKQSPVMTRHTACGAILVLMNRSASEVLDAALALPEEDRGKLADKLVESLDGDLDPDAESAWAAEIERRLSRIDAGEAKMLSRDEAVARMHRAVRGQ